MSKELGFVGLGDMGVLMASRLAAAGLAPVVWARRPERTEALVALGAQRADTLDDLFAACDRVVLMLADAAAMDAVLGRGTPAFAARVGGVTLIHMGTTAPGYSKGLEADVRAAGGAYAEVPVSGSTGPAATGDLVAMTSGAPEALETASQVIGHMCRATVPCSAVPKALQMKLAVNTYLAGLVTGLFEAFNLARTAELDLHTFARVLEAGPMNCDLMRMKLAKLLDGDFAPQGSIRQALNNLTMITEEGERVGAITPIAQVMLDLLRGAEAAGWQDEDMIAAAKVFAARGVAARSDG